MLYNMPQIPADVEKRAAWSFITIATHWKSRCVLCTTHLCVRGAQRTSWLTRSFLTFCTSQDLSPEHHQPCQPVNGRRGLRPHLSPPPISPSPDYKRTPPHPGSWDLNQVLLLKPGLYQLCHLPSALRSFVLLVWVCFLKQVLAV